MYLSDFRFFFHAKLDFFLEFIRFFDNCITTRIIEFTIIFYFSQFNLNYIKHNFSFFEKNINEFI